MNAEQIMAACSNLLLSAAAQNHVALLKSVLELQNLPVDTFYDYVPTRALQPLPKRRTLVMIAAHHGCIDSLSYLLGRGADPNIQSPTDGFTALHCTAEGNSSKTAEVIAYLLSVGAARDATDSYGRKPIDLLLGAQQNQYDDSGSSSGYSTPSVSELDKNEYQSDEFRMFGFKVMKCNRAKAHDWTECPFAHPGEKARRRDPKKFAYSGTACPDFRKGTCKRGDACPFAHGVFECWLHPSRYRTQLCKDAPTCTRRVCFFAHSLEELRQPQAADGTLLPLESLDDDIDCGSSENSPRMGSESGFDGAELSSRASSDVSTTDSVGGGAHISGKSSIRQLSPQPSGSPPGDSNLPQGHPALFNLHSASALSSLSSALQGLVISGNFGPSTLQNLFPQRSEHHSAQNYARLPGQHQSVGFQPVVSGPADVSMVAQQMAAFPNFKDAQRPLVYDAKAFNAALGGKHTSNVPHNLSYSSLDVSWVSVLTDDDTKSSHLPFSSHANTTSMWSHPEIVSS